MAGSFGCWNQVERLLWLLGEGLLGKSLLGLLGEGRLCLLGESGVKLLYRSSEASLLNRCGWGESLLVRGVEWVDKGVDTCAVGAVGDGAGAVELVAADSVGGGKVGAVDVELEVAVGGVVGVDEWVEVGVDWGLVNVVVVEELRDWEGGRDLTDRESLLGNSLLDGSWSEWGRLLGSN